MKKNRMALASAILVSMVLTGCAFSGPTQSSSAGTVESVPASSSASFAADFSEDTVKPAEPIPGENVSNATIYSFPAGVRDASQFFNVEELDLPQTINGFNWGVCDYMDDGHLLVQAYDDLGKHNEFGILDIFTGEYEQLFLQPEEKAYGFCDTDGRYIVYWTMDAVTISSPFYPENLGLGLYDCEEGVNRDIYRHHPKYAALLLNNNVMLWDGGVYFDDAIVGSSGEVERMKLLRYDIATGTVETVQMDAQHPNVLNGELVYVSGPDANGGFELARSSGEPLAMDERFVEIVSGGDELFSKLNLGPGKMDMTIWGVNTMLGQEQIMKSENIIDRMCVNDMALVWNNYLPETPALYLRDPGCGVLFSDLEKGYSYFHLWDDEIFLYCRYDEGPKRFYRIVPK